MAKGQGWQKVRGGKRSGVAKGQGWQKVRGGKRSGVAKGQGWQKVTGGKSDINGVKRTRERIKIEVILRDNNRVLKFVETRG